MVAVVEKVVVAVWGDYGGEGIGFVDNTNNNLILAKSMSSFPKLIFQILNKF